MPASPAGLPPFVGRYQISAHLSGGSIDDVYKGFDPLLERPVAVRVFPLHLNDRAVELRIKETFYAQMQRAGMLTHHGIATLFDAGEWDSALFMASEFVDATNLGDLLVSQIELDVPLRVALFAQVIDALEYAREAGVAHLHLRPSSLLVGGDFSIKVTGFGVAAVADALMTAAGSITAEPSRYSAPERLRGRSAEHRSDVYSAAVVALDLFAGGRAGSRLTVGAIPQIPADLAADGVNSERWRAVFERALAPDPDDRFETPAELEVELLLTLGQGAADAPLAREAARPEVLSASHPTLGSSFATSVSSLVSNPSTDKTTRTADTTSTTTTTQLSEGGETRLAPWPGEDGPSLRAGEYGSGRGGSSGSGKP